MTIANVALTDTFDVWRTRHNQLGFLVNAISEGRANTTGSITIHNNLGGASLNVTNGFVTFSGNVGIGSSNTPNARLQVGGSVYVQNTLSVGANYGSDPTVKGYFYGNLTGGVATVVRNDGTSSGAYAQSYLQTDTGSLVSQLSSNVNGGTAFVYNTGFGALSIYNTRATSLTLGTNSATRLTITGSGDVGINNAYPSEKLDVTGQIKASSGLLVGSQNVIPMISGAYNSSNLVSGAVATANTNITQHGLALTTANTNITQHGLALTTANNNIVSSFAQANSAIGAVATANGNITSAFLKANNAIANTSGVGTAGDLIVSGNLSVGTTRTNVYQLDIIGNKNAALAGSIHNLNNGVGAYSALQLSSTVGSLITQINAHGSGGAGYFYYTGNSALNIYTTTSAPLYFGSNNSAQILTITGNRVGVNQTGPSFPLHVTGTFASTNAIIGSSSDLAISSAGNLLFGGGAQFSIYTTNTQKLGLGTNNNDQRLVIDSSGNVGIGNGSPSYPLHVVSASTIPIYSSTSVVDGASIAGSSHLGVFGYLGLGIFGLYSGNHSYVAGDMQYGGSLVNTSDKRLKEQIVDLGPSLEIINQLKPRSFSWKKNSSQGKMGKTRDIGFIAQEVETILPDLIETHKPIVTNENLSLNDKMDEVKGLSTIKLIPYLVGAIKELAEENQALKAEIENIKKFLKMEG